MAKIVHWGEWVSARASILGFRRQQDLAAEIGSTPQQLSRWIQRTNPPGRMLKGFDESLARALKTTRQILFTDYVRLSPGYETHRAIPSEPRPAQRMETVADADLIKELSRRYVRAARQLSSDLKEAAAVDWTRVAKIVAATSPEADLPAEIKEQVDLFLSLLKGRYTLTEFDVGQSFQQHVPGLVPSGEVYRISRDTLISELTNLWNSAPGFSVTSAGLNLRGAHEVFNRLDPTKVQAAWAQLMDRAKSLQVPASIPALGKLHKKPGKP